MMNFKMSKDIHPSHQMEDWRMTIVTLSSTSRFGKYRCCKLCGAEEAKTVCGHKMSDELKYECKESK